MLNSRIAEQSHPYAYSANGADGDQGLATARSLRDNQIVLEIWRIAIRRRWEILGTIAAAIVLALVATFLSTPQYTAATRMEISREANKIVKVDDVTPESTAVDQEFYQTQYGLLESTSLAERVAQDLRLQDSPAFFAAFGSSLEEASKGPSGVLLAPKDARARRLANARDILLENVSVGPVKGSRLVDVAFTSPDPEMSVKVSDAWAANFIESNLERRFEATAYARRFLEGRLDELRRRLEESERLLVNYAAREKIINLPQSGDSEGSESQKSLVTDNLSALNEAYAEATAARVLAQSRVDQARRTNGGAIAETLENAAISKLRERRAEVAADYSKLMVQFEPEYPAAQALASQLRNLDQSIAREEGRVRQSLESSLRAAQLREDALGDQIDELKSGFIDLRRRSIQYNIYQREVDTNRELYNGLLQRYKEIGVAGGVGANNIAIVDKAERPDDPSSPKLLLNLLVALVVGMGLAALLAFILEQLDDAIHDPAEVGIALGLPMLGTVPVVDGSDPVASLEDPKSPITDAYLSIQTTLQFATAHGVPRTLAVTSTRASEGKSTTSYALAQTLARLKRKVVIVDADMRSPSVHEMFGVPNGAGLSNYLSGSATAAELTRPSPSGNLSIISAGPTPPNAAELLTGDRFAALLTELLAHFDNVVIDSPPVLGLADAPLISSQSEGTVYVVESHGTRISNVKVATSRLLSANAKIVGAVITKFEPRRSGSYGYGYGYGYGHSDNEGTARA